jgi:hypothetical protein
MGQHPQQLAMMPQMPLGQQPPGDICRHVYGRESDPNRPGKTCGFRGSWKVFPKNPLEFGRRGAAGLILGKGVKTAWRRIAKSGENHAKCRQHGVLRPRH